MNLVIFRGTLVHMKEEAKMVDKGMFEFVCNFLEKSPPFCGQMEKLETCLKNLSKIKKRGKGV